MSGDQALVCRPGGRRAALLRERDRLNGIDFVEVLPGPALCVHFFGDVPAVRDSQHPDGLTPADFEVRGGRRVTGIQVLGLALEQSGDDERDDCLRLLLDREGDFSAYQVCIVGVEGFDPRYTCAEVRFRLDCAADLDCATQARCDDDLGPGPDISYLAKDYATFRRLVLDRLAVTMPDWHERHEADLGVTLVELLAYAGDHLSYYQDAVATEAYLNTARRRISVRRHARLVDYLLHEGLNARAWVTVWTDADTPAVPRSELTFATAVPGLVDVPEGRRRLLRADQLRRAQPGSYLVYEPVGDPDEQVVFRRAHSELRFHTWGDEECCLAVGSTSATLLDPDGAVVLRVGDVLVLEEVKGTRTGNPADADPTRRHAVRLTSVENGRDELLGVGVVEVAWGPADALPFALCVSVRLPAPDCRLVTDVSVARGNVELVDHGMGVTEPFGPVGGTTVTGPCGCDGAVLEATTVPHRFAPVLGTGPLTFADAVDRTGPASLVGVRDPHAGSPAVVLTTTTGRLQRWTPRPDLLTSGPDDRCFVVETDDEGQAHLRFGDGELGSLPPVGATFAAAYRVGNGPVGNVGREAITTLVLRTRSWTGVDVRVRNPLAASGGTASEPMAEAKLLAPDAFRARLRRAVTASDYAMIAGEVPGVQAAAAELAWTGSWYEAAVAVDQVGTDDATSELLDRVATELAVVRRLGHDLAVERAHAVPVDLQVEVCVDPQHSRGAVKADVLVLLGSRHAGLFHPDRLTFGTPVRISQVVAAVQAVPGVTSVEVTRLRRLDNPDAGELDAGVLEVRDLEVARLSGDPSLPEQGRLVVVVGGGR